MTNSMEMSHVVLVTGPSGAGRTTAINFLEDAGFEAIDNVPLTLAPRLFEAPVLIVHWRWASIRVIEIFRLFK